MAKRLKRAFTIVELVIVIAVIAILAAVLIPTFTTLIDKANESNDIALVKNLNTALVSKEATDEVNTMQDALDAAYEYGYTVDKLTPSSSGDIVWDEVNNRFALINDGKVVFGDGDVSTGASLWRIAKDTKDFSATYSNYLAGKWTTVPVASTGVDVGTNEGLDVTYTNTDAKQTVTIRTNGGTLTVNGPKDRVNHYGMAVKVVVTAVANESYHEYDEVLGNIELESGRVVVENNATVSTILVTAQSASSIKVEVNSNATVGTVAATKAGVITSENTTVPSTTNKVTGAVTVNKDFAGGFVTEKSQYLVATAEQLTSIDSFGDKMGNEESFSFKLINDITLISKNPQEFEYGSAYIGKFVNSVLDGNGYEIAIDSASLVYTMSNATIKNVVFNFSGVDCAIAGGDYVTASVFENIRTIGNITFSDRNMGLYVVYAYGSADGNAIKFINCTNETNIAGPGYYQAYKGIFVGYYLQGANLVFENCKNTGDFACGKAALFVGNQSREEWVIKLNISNFENKGNVVSTYDSKDNYSQFVGSVVNKANIYIDVNGENYLATDTVFPNVSVLAQDKTLELALNADKTFTVTQATVSDVAYYEVSYGTYVSWWGTDAEGQDITIGTQIEYIKEKIDPSKFVDGAYTTQMKWLDLVTYNYAPEGSTSAEITLGENKYTVVTINGTEYYRMASEWSKLCTVDQVQEGDSAEGVKKASNYIAVSAYNADGTVLATYTLIAE